MKTQQCKCGHVPEDHIRGLCSECNQPNMKDARTRKGQLYMGYKIFLFGRWKIHYIGNLVFTQNEKENPLKDKRRHIIVQGIRLYYTGKGEVKTIYPVC